MELLAACAGPDGFRASPESRDNYDRVWCRDGSMAVMAVVVAREEGLYVPAARTLAFLLEGQHSTGFMPTNRIRGADGAVEDSYGGPVGRVDSGLWWTVAAAEYVHATGDRSRVDDFARAIDRLEAVHSAWEYNGKHLMYVPPSAHWADEYPLEGYALLAQALRVWALRRAGAVFDRADWTSRSRAIEASVRYHFSLEGHADAVLFTPGQRDALESAGAAGRLMSSFGPGSIDHRLDALATGLALGLGLFPEHVEGIWTGRLLDAAAENVFHAVPAYWPPIRPGDPLWPALEGNFAYRFKNRPGHFHNGGLWPMVNGWVAAGLAAAGRAEAARSVAEACRELTGDGSRWPEYVDALDGRPGGVDPLAFSAVGAVLATLADEDSHRLRELFGRTRPAANEATIRQLAARVAGALGPVPPEGVLTVAVCGESGSGKTTLARALAAHYRSSDLAPVILHLDEFFRLPPRRNHLKRVDDFAWIGPGEVRLELLADTVAAIRGGASSVTVPRMDWTTDVEESTDIDVSGCRVVIVEGTYSARVQGMDEVVFLARTHEDTTEARRSRNREAGDDFNRRVLAREHELIAPLRHHATVVVERDGTVVKP